MLLVQFTDVIKYFPHKATRLVANQFYYQIKLLANNLLINKLIQSGDL